MYVFFPLLCTIIFLPIVNADYIALNHNFHNFSIVSKLLSSSLFFHDPSVIFINLYFVSMMFLSTILPIQFLVSLLFFTIFTFSIIKIVVFMTIIFHVYLSFKQRKHNNDFIPVIFLDVVTIYSLIRYI